MQQPAKIRTHKHKLYNASLHKDLLVIGDVNTVWIVDSFRHFFLVTRCSPLLHQHWVRLANGISDGRSSHGPPTMITRESASRLLRESGGQEG